MGFFNWVIIMRPRPKAHTADALKELALNIYTAGGAIRKLSNEGVMRPYKSFRDANGVTHRYLRYVHLQVDLSDPENDKLLKRINDHPDFV